MTSGGAVGPGPLDLWEAGLAMTPAARAVLLLEAAGFPDAADWPVGRRDRQLLRSYCGEGGELSATPECPSCGTTLEIVVNAEDLQAVGGTDDADRVTVELEEHRVVARLPTADDVRALAPAGADGDPRAALLRRCVLEATVAGVDVDPGRLPDQVAAAVEAAMEEADPAADLQLAVSCPDCGAGWSEQLDPVRFAWHAVEEAARTLALDVHVLAGRYGWTEQQILALSPFRRHLYLSAVTG